MSEPAEGETIRMDTSEPAENEILSHGVPAETVKYITLHEPVNICT